MAHIGTKTKVLWSMKNYLSPTILHKSQKNLLLPYAKEQGAAII